MDNSYYSCDRCTFGTVSLKRYNDHIFGHDNQVQNGKTFSIMTILDCYFDKTFEFV